MKIVIDSKLNLGVREAGNFDIVIFIAIVEIAV